MNFVSSVFTWLSYITQRFIEAGGYPGIALFIAVASFNVPIPSEAAYAFSGFLAERGVLNLALVIIVGAFANIAGSTFNYFLGKRQRIARGSGSRFWFIPEREIRHAERWVSKFGNFGVLLGFFMPGLRAFIGFPAGFLGVKFKGFLFMASIGSILWAAVWASLGYFLGVKWERFIPYMRKFDLVILAALVIAGVWVVKKHFLSDHKI